MAEVDQSPIALWKRLPRIVVHRRGDARARRGREVSQRLGGLGVSCQRGWLASDSVVVEHIAACAIAVTDPTASTVFE